jgi:transcriptional/translational regulatory protein YebC/TACO1
MAEPGAVAWQFERKGIVLADRGADEDELMLVALEAGAEDIADDGEAWRITTPATELHAVRSALEEAGVTVESSELTMVPTATIALDSDESAKKVLRLIDILDDNDDVQDVYANFDIPDSILESIEG